MDDFDIEATPLRADGAPEASGQGTPTEAAPSRAAVASPPPPTSPLSSHLTRRARLLRGAGLGAALLLALALLLSAVPGARLGVAGLLGLATPTPTLPLPSGGDVFFWEHTVPWGTLQVDGRPGPNLDVAPTEDAASGLLVPPSFHLPRGRHTLRYSAALFPTRTCIVYVPDVERDTCTEPIGLAGAIPPFVGPPARVLDFGDTVAQLRSADVAALIAATQPALAALAAPATVAPGSMYLAADGRAQRTSQPLLATLTFSVNRDLQYAQVNFQDACVSFCDLPAVNGLAVDAWPLTAHVVARWRYTLPDGQVVDASAPAALDPEDEQIGIVIVARWTGAWHVAVDTSGYGEPGTPPCLVGEAMFDRDSGDPAVGPTASNYHWPFETALPDQGCLLAGGQTVDPNNDLTGAVALVIYRFGLLESANRLAAHIFPSLPLATPADQTLARELGPPGTSD